MNAIDFIAEDIQKIGPSKRMNALVALLFISVPIALAMVARRDELGLWTAPVWGSSLVMIMVLLLFAKILTATSAPPSPVAMVVGVGVLLAMSLWRDDTSGVGHYADSHEFLSETALCFGKGLVSGMLISILVSFILRKFYPVLTRPQRLIAGVAVGASGILMLNIHCPSDHVGHVVLGHWLESVVVFFMTYGFQTWFFARLMQSTLQEHTRSLREFSRMG